MDRERARVLLAKFDFRSLFIEELGWNHYRGRLEVSVDGVAVGLEGIAEKAGMVAFLVLSPLHADSVGRRRIENLVAKSVHEHLLVFCDEQRTMQIWQWVRRSAGQATAAREHRYYVGQSGESLVQKLDALAWTLQESEGGVTIVDVTRRAQAAFDIDRVTKSFYERFKLEHGRFLSFIKGIRGSEAREWYTSVMLNRLMFIYFIQKKGFLDNDPDYLRSRLRQLQARKGRGQFLSFYRHFLLRLFHEGLAKQKRAKELDALVGDVPYLNGGLFDVHELEEANADIVIPDEAFELLFDFFDSYQWHLDDRPLRADDEINPEVLGYIFEQYVNQKQMGAYYTKDDVTGFMAASAVLPLLLDRIETVAGARAQRFVMAAPRRYIQAAIAHGTHIEVSKDGPRSSSEHPGPAVALPGESVREMHERRAWCELLLEQIQNGSVASVADMAKTNLNLHRLLCDVLAELEAPEHVIATYRVLKDLTILDPTCGSGAFLFAALHLLRDLYSIVIDRTEQIVAQGRDTTEHALETLLTEIRRHASREYFILKTIVLSNLYGLDILEEATAIARLRLFLALVAKLRSRAEIEPLPDLDLNIRTGNLLVGVRTIDDAKELFATGLFASAGIPKMARNAHEAADLYREFVELQRDGSDGERWDSLKLKLKSVAKGLRDEIDEAYAGQLSPGTKLQSWRESHKPFHWFVEFPQIMERGGFDAVIGNPPYVRKTKLTGYRYVGFETDDCPDIFAPCIERAADLVRSDGGYAMIVPIAFQFSADYGSARRAIAARLPLRLVSTYSRNPAALFSAGLGVRSTIIVGKRGGISQCLTTHTQRWIEEYRAFLFQACRYEPLDPADPVAPWPRLGHESLVRLYRELTRDGSRIGDAVTRTGPTLGVKPVALYYLSVFIDDPPAWEPSGKPFLETNIHRLHFSTEQERNVAFIVLAGRLACWWWAATGDDFNVPNGVFMSFPVSLSRVKPIWSDLGKLAVALRKEQPKHPIVTLYAGKEIGNYDMSRCRHITDEADQLVLRTLGLERLWDAVLLADARLAKSTGERPGTERAWPFPWKPVTVRSSH